MNHTEEMRMLGYLLKISGNLDRIASSLERLASYKQQEFVSAQAQAVHHDCDNCAHTECSAVVEPCLSCCSGNKWEAKNE